MFSIVVITNTINSRFRGCIASLFPLSYRSDTELIIVLDSDGLESLAKKVLGKDISRLKLVQGPQKGRSAARNAGAAAAEYDLLIFVDGDVLVGPGFIEAHYDHHKTSNELVRGPIYELIGAASSDDIELSKPGFPGLDIASIKLNGFNEKGYRLFTSVLEKAIEQSFIHDDIRLPKWLASAGPNFSISKSLWCKIGGQNEKFGKTWGCEDIEMSYRAVKYGAEIIYTNTAPGYHISHSQPDRWGQHKQSLSLFKHLAQDPTVDCLDNLLGENGSLELYLNAISQIT